MNNTSQPAGLLDLLRPPLARLFLIGIAIRLVGLLFNGMYDLHAMVLNWGFAVQRDGLASGFGINYGILSYAMFGWAAGAAHLIPRFWWAPYKLIILAFDIGVLLALLRIVPSERRKPALVIYWLNPWFLVHEAYHGFWEAPHILLALLAVLAVKRGTRGGWAVAGAFLMGSAMFKPQGFIYFIAPLGIYCTVQWLRGARAAFVSWLAGAAAVAAVTSLLIWVGGGPALALIDNYRSAFTDESVVSNGGPGIWRFFSFVYMKATGQRGPVYLASMPAELGLILSGIAGLACLTILVVFALKISFENEDEPSMLDDIARRLNVLGRTVTRSPEEILLLVMALGSLVLSQFGARAHINHSFTAMVLFVPLAVASKRIFRLWAAMNVLLGLSHVLTFALGGAALVPADWYLARYSAARSLIQQVMALHVYQFPDPLLAFQQWLSTAVSHLHGETLISLASPLVFLVACLLVRSLFAAATGSSTFVSSSALQATNTLSEVEKSAAFVKQFLIPGSLTFLIAGLGVGVVLLSSGPTSVVWGRAWFLSLFGMYWLLSLPAVAHALVSWLQQGHKTLTAPNDALGAKVIVVIGNGSVHYTAGSFASDQLTRRSTFCAFEAARLYALMLPDWIVATGGVGGSNRDAVSEGELLRDVMIRCLVPAERILVESASTTTEEQVANVLKVIGQRDLLGPIVVVTTPAHMSRVMKLFTEGGARAIPSATPELRYDGGLTGWRRWWPNRAALIGSESALYEGSAHVHSALK